MTACTYPNCDCAVSFPEGYRPSVATECPRWLHPSITPDRILAACESDEYEGFCAACGAEAEGVEPDARKYVCATCGERAVYGAEELLIMTEA
jgi:DNA-directed RNA polymerase subunit RPC12/RpoP